jgi:hypothetical protein
VTYRGRPGFDSRQGHGFFLLSTASRPALEPGALPPGIKQSMCEAYHSPPFIAEVKSVWSCTSTLHMSTWSGAQVSTGYVFMTWYLVKHRDFTLVYLFILMILHYLAHNRDQWRTLLSAVVNDGP